MEFAANHWEGLVRDGYTVVAGAVAEPALQAAQDAAGALNAAFPEGWERSKNESWREIRHCRHPALLAICRDVLDPLAREIVEDPPEVDFVQLAATFPGFATKGGVGRNFHVDAGQQPALDVFNILMGVALTHVESDTAGSFHVLPGSHDQFAGLFGEQPTDPPVHWGEIKLLGQKKFLSPRMVVPHVKAGDVIVAHSFLAHGTSANTTDVRRDMFFQRRAAAPLKDPVRQAAAREAFMRNPWSFFRR